MGSRTIPGSCPGRPPQLTPYVVDGGPGSDIYALNGGNLTVTIDGRFQSGTDAIIFHRLLRKTQ